MRVIARSGRRTHSICALAATAVLAPLCALTPACGVARTVVSSVTHRPEHAGQCFSTRVRRVENRLREGDDGPFTPGSGSAVRMTDGHYTVEYSQVRATDRSRPGDRVRMCVRNLPGPCPPGDTRGIVYRVRDLSTGLHWTSSDSEHPCGGA